MGETVITEALRVLLLGVLGVFLVMALIYVVIVTLSRIRVPSNAGATESNLVNESVVAPEQPSDFRNGGAAEPIVADDLAADHMADADEWYENHEYDSEISEYHYGFSEHGGEFDGDDEYEYEYEYVLEEYYPDDELIDADQDTDAEESRSAQIEEVKP